MIFSKIENLIENTTMVGKLTKEVRKFKVARYLEKKRL